MSDAAGTHPPQDYPGHAIGQDGGLCYDARCWWCRQVTAQPPATAKAAQP